MPVPDRADRRVRALVSENDQLRERPIAVAREYLLVKPSGVPMSWAMLAIIRDRACWSRSSSAFFARSSGRSPIFSSGVLFSSAFVNFALLS